MIAKIAKDPSSIYTALMIKERVGRAISIKVALSEGTYEEEERVCQLEFRARILQGGGTKKFKAISVDQAHELRSEAMASLEQIGGDEAEKIGKGAAGILIAEMYVGSDREL